MFVSVALQLTVMAMIVELYESLGYLRLQAVCMQACKQRSPVCLCVCHVCNLQYAHPKEKARRRDPRVYKYASTPCPESLKGVSCGRGVDCPYAHSVYEYW